MHLTLAFNPSHLEIVNPVVEGSVRARQHRRKDREGRQVTPVLIHGDAAFAGQGVVMETLNLSQTRGYRTGGTVHIIVNNQIGFTTSDVRDVRSTLYCTDIVKMVEAPVFHVNGDDPEAVVLVTELALDFRMQFQKDVVIDLVCFRRHGHNEQDEPMVTQPLMYKIVSQHPGTRKLYVDKLAAQGAIRPEDADEMIKAYRSALDAGYHTNKNILTNFHPPYAVNWDRFRGAKWTDRVDTGVPLLALKQLADRLTTVPPRFKLHPRVEKVIADRRQMADGKLPLDWGMAENLAYAALLKDGYGVRLSGQDSGRGTFFHRHAVLHDQARERWDAGTYIPLQHIAENQPAFVVIDSVLSEEAVMGFEYGYATAEPNDLVVWEAQFGDFANGAQVVIDQFIASGEVKWGRLCGLTLMLPHGYEGQGPEHSSGRLERFLQLCADYNMQICVPFHSGSDVSHAAATDAAPVPQAAHHHEPQEHAAAEGVGVEPGGSSRGPVPSSHRGNRRDQPRGGAAGRVLQREGVLRRTRGAPGTRHQGRGDRAARATLPVPARRLHGADPAVFQSEGSDLVPGRAGQPGGLASHSALPVAPYAARSEARLCAAPILGFARGRLPRAA